MTTEKEKLNNSKELLQKETEKEISTSNKITSPMNMAIAFQSCANRIQQEKQGKLEYGERYIKLGNVEYGERYVRYENQNNEVKELNEKYKK